MNERLLLCVERTFDFLITSLSVAHPTAKGDQKVFTPST